MPHAKRTKSASPVYIQVYLNVLHLFFYMLEQAWFDPPAEARMQLTRSTCAILRHNVELLVNT